MNSSAVLCKNALRVTQNERHPLFLFTLTGQELEQVACVSQVSRDQGGDLIGYQRPEVREHIRAIAEYLERDHILLPNSIILAFNSQVQFEPASPGNALEDPSEPGVLGIPIPNGHEARPGWIVDGQQRTAALTGSSKRDLPVPICAFVADDVEVHREQFLRVNSVKPLPRGLVTELLPHMEEPLGQKVEARTVASRLCDNLTRHPDSPFLELIRRPSGSGGHAEGPVTDTSVVAMVEHSLTSPTGCLFPYWNLATGTIDEAGCLEVLMCYWSAVKKVFPLSWGLSPRQSRLMHGVGIRSMGRLMDRVMAGMDLRKRGTRAAVERDLEMVAPYCRWTEGIWEDLDSLRWNEVQNVPRHIRNLSSYLVRTYLEVKGHRP